MQFLAPAAQREFIDIVLPRSFDFVLCTPLRMTALQKGLAAADKNRLCGRWILIKLLKKYVFPRFVLTNRGLFVIIPSGKRE